MLEGLEYAFKGFNIPSESLSLAQEGIFLASKEVHWYIDTDIYSRGGLSVVIEWEFMQNF